MSSMARALVDLLNGPEDIGRLRLFWSALAIALALLLLLPLQVNEFQASNVAYYLLNIPMALGLCLLWGYFGVLSFGPVAYFGIAGYAYGIIAGNMVGSAWGALIGSVGRSVEQPVELQSLMRISYAVCC